MQKLHIKKKFGPSSFSYPVVPRNKSRIRIQISSIHTKKNLDTAIKNFKEIGKN